MNTRIDENYPINELIIPFKFTSDRIESIANDLVSKKWGVVNPLKSNEFFTHVESLLDNTKKNSIGLCLSKRMEGDLTEVILKSSGKKIASISGLKVILFKTGVGFLIVSMRYPNHITLNNLIKINNKLKSIEHDEFEIGLLKEESLDLNDDMVAEGSFDSNKSIEVVDHTDGKKRINVIIDNLPDMDRSGEVKITYGENKKKVIRFRSTSRIDFRDYLYEELRPIPLISYFNLFKYNKGNREMASKTHIFTSCLLDEYNLDKDKVSESAFLLSRGYKHSYKKKLEDDESQFFSTFENSTWSISREGVSNLTWLVDDSSTNDFFRGTYFERIGNYLFLYIIALHQYYSLIMISQEISYIPSKTKDYINDSGNYEELLHIYDEVNFLYLKCVYHEITYITHQTKVYKNIYNVLGIDILLDEINYEMDRLTGLVNQIREFHNLQKYRNEENRYRERHEERQLIEKRRRDEEELKKKREKKYAIIGSTFAFFSVFKTLWEISILLEINSFVNSRLDDKVIHLLFATLVMVIGVLIGILIYFLWESKGEKPAIKWR